MASAGERLIHELLHAVRDPAVRAALLAVLGKWSGRTVYLPIQRASARRAAVARDLLDDGHEPAEVAEIIAARFGVTLRTAQRDLQATR